ncbi:MAG: pilin [Candidatus Pacebacteria bacterium]|nr:pilin [Candidatus Paceibacterota bacterium]
MPIKQSAKESLAKFVCLVSSLLPFAVSAKLEAIEGVPSKPLTDVLSDLTKWVLEFGLALCVILIIWSGITYIAATGDEERIKKSKKTIHYAIYGIAIIGLSFAMIKVVNDVLITN